VAERVLILGASARAAAASARRAGLEPFAIDLFADRDTKQICEVLRCPFEDYPEGLFRLARTAPPMPWMYTGGLENYPELVGELAKERELWGNGPEVLKRVRDPKWLKANLNGMGYHYPDVVMPGDCAPPDGKWVHKPLRGAGGIGVRLANDRDMQDIEEADSNSFLQQYIPSYGLSSSAFVVPRASNFIIGATRQLSGNSWCHAEGFHYSGSIGPLHDADLSNLRRTAYRLQDVAEVCSIWGIDFVPWDAFVMVIEVNPRYTASIEVIEYATGFCSLNPSMTRPKAVPYLVGKAIYYAPARLTFPASGPWDDSLAHAADVWTRPDFADIPHPGDVIEAGQPILTILTDAATEDACLAKLKARAAELDRLFGFATPTEDERCPP
jgi:predicted ATP-grasp superfamily ATP-dependent carboligase